MNSFWKFSFLSHFESARADDIGIATFCRSIIRNQRGWPLSDNQQSVQCPGPGWGNAARGFLRRCSEEKAMAATKGTMFCMVRQGRHTRMTPDKHRAAVATRLGESARLHPVASKHSRCKRLLIR